MNLSGEGFRRITVRPATGALGAEIGGVDLANVDEETLAEVRRALLEYLVITFPDQQLTPEAHKAFGARFGVLDRHPFAAGLEDHPEILPIVKEASDRGGNFGGTWHADLTFYEAPSMGSILYAKEVPPAGGDTLFANQYLAYETLSPALRRTLDGMTALHSAARGYGEEDSRQKKRNEEGKSMDVRLGRDAERLVEHPVVRTHPETGRKALFVNGVFTQRFAGWTQEESAPLLAFLNAHAVRPEFTCRFRWTRSMVLFWDNRCTQHFAVNDYHGHRREMHRVTVAGDRPYYRSQESGSRLAA